MFAALARHRSGPLGLKLFLDEVGLPETAAAEDESHGPVAGVMFPEPMPSLRELEERAVAEALSRTGGNLSAAARVLGVSRPTVRRLRERAALGLDAT